jgi:ankyrin repeat protein
MVTPLAMGADCNCSVSVMRFLIDQGAAVDAFDEMHWTPLHWAIRRNGDSAVLRLLLERGSNPNAKHPAVRHRLSRC